MMHKIIKVEVKTGSNDTGPSHIGTQGQRKDVRPCIHSVYVLMVNFSQDTHIVEKIVQTEK